MHSCAIVSSFTMTAGNCIFVAQALQRKVKSGLMVIPLPPPPLEGLSNQSASGCWLLYFKNRTQSVGSARTKDLGIMFSSSREQPTDWKQLLKEVICARFGPLTLCMLSMGKTRASFDVAKSLMAACRQAFEVVYTTKKRWPPVDAEISPCSSLTPPGVSSIFFVVHPRLAASSLRPTMIGRSQNTRQCFFVGEFCCRSDMTLRITASSRYSTASFPNLSDMGCRDQQVRGVNSSRGGQQCLQLHIPQCVRQEMNNPSLRMRRGRMLIREMIILQYNKQELQCHFVCSQ